jgi:hypothetical protein
MKFSKSLVSLLALSTFSCSKSTLDSNPKGIGVAPPVVAKSLVCQVGELKGGVLSAISKETKALSGTEVLVEFDETKLMKGLSASGLLNGDQLSVFFDLALPSGKVSSSTLTDKAYARLSFTLADREFLLACEVSQLPLAQAEASSPSGASGPTGASSPSGAVGPSGAVVVK